MQRSYWKVRLSTGKELAENETKVDIIQARSRPIDWALDLASTGDVLKIVDLWLISGGQSAHLEISEPGTAFQMKTVTSFGMGGEQGKQLEYQLIGRVDDKVSGDCTCYVCDRLNGLFIYQSTIHHFGRWREGLAPIGALNQAVMGLKLD